MDRERDARRDLMRAPGIGPSMAADLLDLGIDSLDQVAGADPQELYDRLTARRGVHIDRCVLYVFRCAQYFASRDSHDPELLKWWNWKDRA